MRRSWRIVSAAMAIALAASGCGGGPAAATSPRPVPPPRVTSLDRPAARATKLARYMERRWPRIHIESVRTSRGGSVVVFHDQVSFDYSIKDPDEYVRSVQRLTGDLDQASVELLQLSVRYFPNLRDAGVWQDQELQALWTKEQIVAMDRPDRYRSSSSFLRLIFAAQYPPAGAPPPAPTS